MSTNSPFHQSLTTRRFRRIALAILTLAASANVFGFLGFGDSIKWKQEVLLHDGRKIIVERSHSYGGSREIGQSPSIGEQDITFSVPGSNQRITWNDEYDKNVGGSNFNLLALHILNGTPYIVATPNLIRAYWKWGKPNPPYVLFKYDGKAWQRISLAELPMEFKDINLAVVGTKADEKIIKSQSPMSVELVKKFNRNLSSPENKAILREPLTREPYPTIPGSFKAPGPDIPSSPTKRIE